jgi:cation transport ATPase
MDLFDTLKNKWQSQEAPEKLAVHELQEKAEQESKRQQRKLVFNNLWLSVCFAGVFVVFGWIWQTHPGRSMFFYGGMLAAALLMLSVLAIQWFTIQYKSFHAYKSTQHYLKSSIRKVKVRIFMARYGMLYYAVLLFICIVFYYTDVLQEASFQFQFWAYFILTAYFLLVYFFTRKKRKRKVKDAEDLMEHLKEWQEGL